MYQQITLVGNLGADPEMRYTPSGVPVTRMRVAVNKAWTSQDGTRNEKTTWFTVSAWRGLAETCSKYLSKGRQVLVVGEIDDPYIYTDQEGNQRGSLQVTAQMVKFLGGRGDAEYAGSSYGSSTTNGGPSDDISGEEDIPF